MRGFMNVPTSAGFELCRGVDPSESLLLLVSRTMNSSASSALPLASRAAFTEGPAGTGNRGRLKHFAVCRRAPLETPFDDRGRAPSDHHGAWEGVGNMQGCRSVREGMGFGMETVRKRQRQHKSKQRVYI